MNVHVEGRSSAGASAFRILLLGYSVGTQMFTVVDLHCQQGVHCILQLENVAIANALQLEAARRCAVPIRFNSLSVPTLNLRSLSTAVLESFYCLYVTLRGDLEL